MLDVRAALAATGQHQRHLHEDLAPVVQRERSPVDGMRDRERITEPNRSAKAPKSVQPDVGHDTGPTGFHNDATRAGTVHFGSALLVEGCCCVDNTSFPYMEGISADAARSAHGGSVNSRG